MPDGIAFRFRTPHGTVLVAAKKEAADRANLMVWEEETCKPESLAEMEATGTSKAKESARNRFGTALMRSILMDVKAALPQVTKWVLDVRKNQKGPNRYRVLEV